MIPLTRTGATAPTFVGIGPPKCGTTWLDAALRRHPDILLPKSVKEVFYFSRYHDRGSDWYRGLFSDAGHFVAAGEISTNYILQRNILDRIAALDPGIKIVVMLRDPTDRLISHYRMLRENAALRGSFDEAISSKGYLVRYSEYQDRLRDIDAVFSRDQILVGIFEEIFANTESQLAFLQRLASFLDVDPEAMRNALPGGKIRETRGYPRYPVLTRAAKRVRRLLRDWNMEETVGKLERLGLRREVFLKKGAGQVAIDPETRARLDLRFAPARRSVEEYLGRPIPSWPTSNRPAPPS